MIIMKYKIDLPQSWRPGGRVRMIHAGVYRVPEDMAEGMAERALAEGGAMKIVQERSVEPLSSGFRAKGPAPENKRKPAADAPQGRSFEVD